MSIRKLLLLALLGILAAIEIDAWTRCLQLFAEVWCR
jgi:hypothetical protein